MNTRIHTLSYQTLIIDRGSSACQIHILFFKNLKYLINLKSAFKLVNCTLLQLIFKFCKHTVPPSDISCIHLVLDDLLKYMFHSSCTELRNNNFSDVIKITLKA